MFFSYRSPTIFICTYHPFNILPSLTFLFSKNTPLLHPPIFSYCSFPVSLIIRLSISTPPYSHRKIISHLCSLARAALVLQFSPALHLNLVLFPLFGRYSTKNDGRELSKELFPVPSFQSLSYPVPHASFFFLAALGISSFLTPVYSFRFPSFLRREGCLPSACCMYSTYYSNSV